MDFENAMFFICFTTVFCVFNYLEQLLRKTGMLFVQKLQRVSLHSGNFSKTGNILVDKTGFFWL